MAGAQASVAERWIGRSFVHPAFDYLLIGGGLSLAVTAFVVLHPQPAELVTLATLPYFVLISNAAHFAASTVRLYTKPGTRKELPFLTMAFPIVALAILSLSMFFAGQLGTHLQSLYLTWSPYHYAAQAYGLAVMYSHRSGCHLNAADKRLLRWVAMLPFLYNFITAPRVGLRWLLPASFWDDAVVRQLNGTIAYLLIGLAIAGPLYFAYRTTRHYGRPVPLISLLCVVTNGIWFFVLAPLQAFVYATIFHGVQYLAIVILFHLRDQMSRPDNRRGTLYHVLWFYGASLVLGYGLFSCLPLAYIFAGFGRPESVLLVVAAINIHHFIVDAYIWKLQRDQSNRRVVEAGAVATA